MVVAFHGTYLMQRKYNTWEWGLQVFWEIFCTKSLGVCNILDKSAIKDKLHNEKRWH